MLYPQFQGSPVYVALLILSGLLFLNLLTLLNLAEALDIIKKVDLVKTDLIIAYFSILALNLLYFFTDKTHSKIIEKYNNTEPQKHKIRRALVIIYTVLSFVLVFVSVSWK